MKKHRSPSFSAPCTQHTDDNGQERLQHLQHPRVHCTVPWQARALQDDLRGWSRLQVCVPSEQTHHTRTISCGINTIFRHHTARTLHHSTRTGPTQILWIFSRVQSAKSSQTRRFAPTTPNRNIVPCLTCVRTQSEWGDKNAGKRGPWVQRAGALARL